MLNAETDKRKSHRADVRFRVSCPDISQTTNISEGGMAFTTSRQFAPHTDLAVKIDLPVTQEPVHITGKVIESKKVNPHYVYFTRISFNEMDEQKRRAIQQTVAYYSRKNRLRF